MLLASGSVIFSFACIASIFESPYLPTLVVIFILAGLQVAIVGTVEGAYTADLLGDTQRGSGFGALQTVNGVGDLTSSTLIGVMLTYSSPQLGFTPTAAIAIAGAAVLLDLTRNRSPSDRASEKLGQPGL